MESARLVHELQVHQIELEMQNEELQLARAQADELLARYTDLYDFVPTGYLTLDRAGTIRLVNLTGARMLGVERSRLVKRRFGLFVAESDRRTFGDFLVKVFAREARESCEVTLPHSGSQPLVVQIEATRSADGQECRVAMLDVTERKQTEEALRESEERRRSHADNSPLAVVEWNADLRITQWTGAAERMFGWSAAEAIGQPIMELPGVYEEDISAVQSGVRQLADGGSKQIFSSNRNRTKNGQVIACEWYNSVLRDAGGKTISVLSQVLDVTERKQAEAEVRKVNRALHLISLFNQEMVRATDEAVLMQTACRLAVNPAGYRLAWIGFAGSDEAKSVRPVASAGFEEGYLDTVNITWADAERGHGPTGTAIRTGQPVMVRHITTDPTYEPWRVPAIRHGYASAIALPLWSQGRCFGALMIYAGEPDAFDAQETKLLTELASDLAYGIDALRQRVELARVEAAVREREQRLAFIYDTVGDVIFLLTVEAEGHYRFTSVNYAFLATAGLTAAQVVGRRVDEVIPKPSLDLVLAKYADAIREKKIVRWEETSDYPTGRLTGEVSIAPVFDEAGHCTHLVGAVHDVTERKRAEQKAERAAREWQTTFDATNDAIWILDRDHRILRTNKTAENFFQRTCGEMIGKPCWEVVHGTTEPILECPFVRARQSGHRETMELLVGARWFGITVDPTLDAAGQYAGGVHIVSDITERKQAEAELRESEKKLRETQRMAQLGHWIWDVKTGQVEWSEEVFNLFRLDPGEFTPRIDSILALSPWPEDHARDQELIRKAMALHEKGSYDQRFLRPDGSIGYYHSTFQGTYDARGELVSIVGTVMDITERKQTEEALRASEQEFRSLAEAMPQIVWVCQPDGRNIYFNQQWVDYTGLTLEESHGHGWNKPFHPDDRQRAWDAWQNATQNDAPYALECRLRRADGAYRWWLIRGVPLREAGGKILKWFGTYTDIDGIKQAEAALREQTAKLTASNDALTRFNRATVDRELRMIELKREINALCTATGNPSRYPLNFSESESIAAGIRPAATNAVMPKGPA